MFEQGFAHGWSRPAAIDHRLKISQPMREAQLTLVQGVAS